MYSECVSKAVGIGAGCWCPTPVASPSPLHNWDHHLEAVAVRWDWSSEPFGSSVRFGCYRRRQGECQIWHWQRILDRKMLGRRLAVREDQLGLSGRAFALSPCPHPSKRSSSCSSCQNRPSHCRRRRRLVEGLFWAGWAGWCVLAFGIAQRCRSYQSDIKWGLYMPVTYSSMDTTPSLGCMTSPMAQFSI
jgi:hypothetical protein